jgi:hypothetical protein
MRIIGLQYGQLHLLPEPCIVYGSLVHTALPRGRIGPLRTLKRCLGGRPRRGVDFHFVGSHLMQYFDGLGRIAKSAKFVAVGCGQSDALAGSGLRGYEELAARGLEQDGAQAPCTKGSAELV